MFCDVYLEIWVAQVGHKRPNDHQENKDPKPGINQQPNGPLAEEGSRFERIGRGRIH